MCGSVAAIAMQWHSSALSLLIPEVFCVITLVIAGDRW
jgi:hypothetical protein